jgi:NAD(P)-dependent dehydrogenase (short-subunit alcohol dehydrogenase family)
MRRPVVLVTGGSRGIGAATARLAAARGYDVALTYRSEREAAHSVVAECRALGAKACAVAGDIAAEADIVRFFDEAARELGPIGMWSTMPASRAARAGSTAPRPR